MTPPAVACFCMPEEGHLRRMLPIIRGLSARGMAVHVCTSARFRVHVEGAGGILVDLFGAYPLAAADDASLPVPCRYVSFAGHYAAEIIADMRRLQPVLAVYDTFAVIGRVVAEALGVPGVNVCAGHNVAPKRFLDILDADPRVRLHAACERAAERLRDEYGMSNASPFGYVDGLSRWLNVYCEPEAFLSAEERAVFEPIAFFGSLPSIQHIERRRRAPEPPQLTGGERRIYVSFGTVVWRYYATEALAAMSALAQAAARDPTLRMLISLGGSQVDAAAVEALRAPNVTVESRVDQWAVLGEVDTFVTHHGLNSTHEAIFHGVSMLSYPFFWDQPGLAAKCLDFGIATPFSTAPRGLVTVDEAEQALAQIGAARPAMRARLGEARQRELDVMATRGAVIDRIVALA